MKGYLDTTGTRPRAARLNSNVDWLIRRGLDDPFYGDKIPASGAQFLSYECIILGMPEKGRGELVTLALMILTTAFWGMSFIAGKIALREFPPITLTFFRFLFATALILPIMWATEERRVPRKEDIPMLVGLGFLGVSGYYTFQFTALLYTSASNSATCGRDKS